ncbi:MAG: ImmA/IrrE family metallo-endopeptidase [Desulfobacterales bacterium]|nr:ImmA/IrrE family metallo-endopeptidase [Desulfobacterales bacterium]
MESKLEFIGRNIRYLRRERGWTIAHLASKAKISEVPLGRIERGVNAPSANAIYHLAKALDVSVDTIFAEEHESLRIQRFEGKKKPFLVSSNIKNIFSLQLKSMAKDMIEGFQALEDICGVQKRAKIPLLIPFDADEDGMEILSLTVRRYMGIEYSIVFDYFELFENQGFRVIAVPMPKAIDGFSYYDPVNQNAFFFLNAKKNPERQLFHLAYELCNILITTASIQRNETLAENADLEPYKKKTFTDHRAASHFAATFLMPSGAVVDTVRQLGIQKKQWSYELLLRIKHRFGVSSEAFLYRLDELALIHPSLLIRLKHKIKDHYKETGYGEPDFSRRLLTPNGRLWDLVLTGKEFSEGRKEILEIEQLFEKWKVVKC